VKILQKSKSMLGFLAGILLLVLMGSYQAQAAWTKSENSRFKALERRVQELETQLRTQGSEKKTIKFLAIRGSIRVCPGDSYPILDFPFNPGEGYSVPARMSTFGSFSETIQLIYCAIDITGQR
jgi:hypothetical protein